MNLLIRNSGGPGAHVHDRLCARGRGEEGGPARLGAFRIAPRPAAPPLRFVFTDRPPTQQAAAPLSART